MKEANIRALNLPTEVDRDKFTEFLEEIKRDFPSGELFVQYQEVDNKVIVLGIGSTSDCAEQVTQAFQRNPRLKKRKLKFQILRAPKSGFLVR